MQVIKWGLFEISRENIRFTRVYGLNQNSKLLTEVLPFGSVPGQSIKCTIADDMICFSYLRMNGQKGIGITLAFDLEAIPDNVLGFLPEMMSVLESSPPELAPLDINPRKIAPPASIQIKNFDSAIFSFITGFPTVILGNEDEILELIFAMSASLPKKMRARFWFVTQSTSLSENVNIIGMPFSTDILSELSEARGKYTVVVLGDHVYGQFSSQLCKKMAFHAEKGQYEQIKDLLTDFYELVRDSEELPSALKFAHQHGLHLSDAQLALIMRARYFGKEVPEGLVER
ncbi:MAG: hypothetical protein ACFFBD_25095 [Candidatus Hodarchaeota archaeon]